LTALSDSEKAIRIGLARGEIVEEFIHFK